MFPQSGAYAAKVAICGIGEALYYLIPDDLAWIDAGAQVEIDLAKRRTQGWVIERLSLETALEQLKLLSLARQTPGSSSQL